MSSKYYTTQQMQNSNVKILDIRFKLVNNHSTRNNEGWSSPFWRRLIGYQFPV
jgi:hypothetical protein